MPRYDFNWQHVYELTTPLSLADVDALKFSVVFDNSAANPFNPDPAQHVTWGDQTWEEMAVAFFEVAVPRNSQGDATKDQGVVHDSSSRAEQEAVVRRVREFLERFDRNQDGVVERLETPLSFRRFGFYRFDLNGDERLTREEIEQASARE